MIALFCHYLTYIAINLIVFFFGFCWGEECSSGNLVVVAGVKTSLQTLFAKVFGKYSRYNLGRKVVQESKI